ncbi:MAG: hypothetical protein COA78_20835 [Blastopirellula sp.]|nr:MAG: hypothetical protein COA78_20835 [Blastopirellula sp.]
MIDTHIVLGLFILFLLLSSLCTMALIVYHVVFNDSNFNPLRLFFAFLGATQAWVFYLAVGFNILPLNWIEAGALVSFLIVLISFAGTTIFWGRGAGSN